MPRQRGTDPDSPWKSLLDSLVHAKALIDDDRHHVEIMPVEYVEGERPATTVILEDVP